MIVGIDPGVKGAVAILRDDGTQIHDLTEYVNDNHSLLCRVLPADPVVYIENPAPGGWGAKNVAALFRVIGGIEVSLTMLKSEINYVPPQTWMTFLGLKYAVTKNDRRHWIYYTHAERLEKARKLYPAADFLERASDHNRADALLIAHYGRKCTART